MITYVEGVLQIEGEMTIAKATTLLAQGSALLEKYPGVSLDLAGVTEVDSAGLAVIFAWQRRAPVIIRNPPPSLSQLADLYGTADWLPVASV